VALVQAQLTVMLCEWLASVVETVITVVLVASIANAAALIVTMCV
jgi:hypothetical protein